MVTNYVALPPDGGWGWVVVTASFFCNMVVDGIVFSFGVLLDHIATEFGISTSKATITGSLLSGVYLISGTSPHSSSSYQSYQVSALVETLGPATHLQF